MEARASPAKGFRSRLLALGRQQTLQTNNIEYHDLSKKYIIFELLAVGNRSTIYKGIEEKTGLQRAFKYYNFRELEAQKDWREKEVCKRLSVVEVDIMRSCQSSNILYCHDVYEDPFSKVLVLDYCNQGTLKDEIRRRNFKPTNEVRAVIILKQILSGLRSLHMKCRKLHKNLRSQKIMIKNGVYKLLDFGLPDVLGLSDGPKEDCFLVPELLRKQSFDSKAEVWSVGVLFHEILYGELPELVNRKNKGKLLGQGQKSAFTRPQNQRGDYHPSVFDFLEQCLKIEPQDRMNWTQLEAHSMLQQVGNNKTLLEGNSSIQRMPKLNYISMMVPFEGKSREQMVMQIDSREQQVVYNMKFRMDDQRGRIEEQLKASYIKSEEKYLLTKLQLQMVEFYKRRINIKQDQSYSKLKEYYWKCLKMQFIQQNIYAPLINPQILPQDKRQVIQFIYLIISRSFHQISKIIEFTKHQEHFSKQHSLMEQCIVKQTQNLYSVVHQAFTNSTDRLKKVQDRYLSIFSDRFNKTFRSAEYQEKERRMQGIIGVDLTIKEQMDYTIKIFNEKGGISQLLGKQNGKEQARKLHKYIEVYQDIWAIPQQEQEMWSSIKEYVNSNLIKNWY